MDSFEQIRKEFLEDKVKPTHWLGDSLDRFDLYKSYASECESITELGVHTGSSTIAFLSGFPKKMRSYDITEKYFHLKPRIENICSRENIDFKFAIGNSCHIDIEETDLLFIDTLHDYRTITAELAKHHNKARKYIVAHDTTSFPPVFKGIQDFLSNHLEWEIHYKDEKDCGVTILKRLN